LAKSNSKKESDIDFEAALEELEALVGKMETGKLSLEDSLAAFERGVNLTRQCQVALDNAKLRVNALMPDGSSEELEIEDNEP
jgi:exodeoxyribonuclease VII small subunit|tara:strand:+ start:1647 stop:1895 length:249 start_codon:yes stop_codon:yes gene_type:complete